MMWKYFYYPCIIGFKQFECSNNNISTWLQNSSKHVKENIWYFTSISFISRSLSLLNVPFPCLCLLITQFIFFIISQFMHTGQLLQLYTLFKYRLHTCDIKTSGDLISFSSNIFAQIALLSFPVIISQFKTTF